MMISIIAIIVFVLLLTVMSFLGLWWGMAVASLLALAALSPIAYFNRRKTSENEGDSE